MNFTQIENENVVEIPAVEKKVFDKQWLSHIRINSTPSKAQVVAHLVPYNGTEILSEPDEEIVVNNLFADMADENHPAELRTLKAQAMEVILQVVKAEKAYQKAVEEARLEAIRLAQEQVEEVEPLTENDDTNNTQPE